jgi:hypothetical protein
MTKAVRPGMITRSLAKRIIAARPGMMTRGLAKKIAKPAQNPLSSLPSKPHKPNQNIICYRASTQDKLADGKSVKRALFFSDKLLTEPDDLDKKSEFIKTALSVLEHDPLIRPAIITEYSEDGHPQKAMTLTPEKTILDLCARYPGSHSEFSNQGDESSTIVEKKKTRKKKSRKNTLKVPPPEAPKKIQCVTITREDILRTREQLKKNNGRRIKSQGSIMGGSAEHYAQSLKMGIEDARHEWLHLIAHRFIGNHSQNANNLVGGLKDINTIMMFFENELFDFILKHYPQGFILRAESTLEPGTQLAKKIDYTIITDDFKQTFVLDGRHKRKPHCHEQVSIRAIFAGLIRIHTDHKIEDSPLKRIIRTKTKKRPLSPEKLVTPPVNSRSMSASSLFYHSPEKIPAPKIIPAPRPMRSVKRTKI